MAKHNYFDPEEINNKTLAEIADWIAGRIQLFGPEATLHLDLGDDGTVHLAHEETAA